MIQRIAHLVLVTVLLANQSIACCAHSHESDSGATPHIHLSWNADGAHSHGHHHHGHHHHGHSHHGHSHSHEASHSHHAPTSNSSDQNESDPNLRSDSLADQHEDGLIYCTDSNFLSQSNPDCVKSVGQFAVSNDSVSLVASTTDRMPQTMPTDARARYRSGIFLQTRSLRL